MNQATFNFTAPFQSRSYTSLLAAKSIEPKAGTLRAAVLKYIRVLGEHGATDDECQADLGMEGSTQRPRRIELLQQGLIHDSGKERLTRSGKKAVVWTATRQTFVGFDRGSPDGDCTVTVFYDAAGIIHIEEIKHSKPLINS